MISEKVLGAYASVGSLSPAEQAEWYKRAQREWGINCFVFADDRGPGQDHTTMFTVNE